MGITPTGTSVSFTAMNFYRFADGKIIGEVGQPDLVSLLGQLGQSPLQTPF
jgi:predicted ester cyclase